MEMADVCGLPPLIPSGLWSAKSAAEKARKWDLSQRVRSDGLVLRHWAPCDSAHTAQEAASADLSLTYSDSEYDSLLASPEWSRADTDLLIQLAQDFNHNFIVVHDRFESADGTTSRSVEDLKERYCHIASKIIPLRTAATGAPFDASIFTFNKDRETQRKKNLEALHARSVEAVQEEEMLFYELKRRELYGADWQAERDHLVQIMANHELPVPMQLPPIPGSSSSGSTESRKKKRAADAASGEHTKRKSAAVASALESVALAKRDTPQGVFIRGQRLLTPRASNLASKFKELLEEYNLLNPPLLPNTTVCDVADEVRSNVMVLLDIRKTVERLEHETISLRERKRMLLAGEVLAGGPSGGGAAPARADSGSTSDEYDEVEARKKKKAGGGGSGGGGSGSGIFKKARFH
ncbi:DNA methyltransferase 1-associated protein 1 [Chytriomyces hyalinus]|nr:DNA methyltransferase 1-associated protein 1 [Chytriomyces hyalinus]KAJ3265890.1 DNA methyltransferase 1-associated protein 1 [Chytriomyces hyalinus]